MNSRHGGEQHDGIRWIWWHVRVWLARDAVLDCPDHPGNLGRSQLPSRPSAAGFRNGARHPQASLRTGRDHRHRVRADAQGPELETANGKKRKEHNHEHTDFGGFGGRSAGGGTLLQHPWHGPGPNINHPRDGLRPWRRVRDDGWLWWWLRRDDGRLRWWVWDDGRQRRWVWDDGRLRRWLRNERW